MVGLVALDGCTVGVGARGAEKAVGAAGDPPDDPPGLDGNDSPGAVVAPVALDAEDVPLILVVDALLDVLDNFEVFQDDEQLASKFRYGQDWAYASCSRRWILNIAHNLMLTFRVLRTRGMKEGETVKHASCARIYL
jgi:hypothetical protein